MRYLVHTIQKSIILGVICSLISCVETPKEPLELVRSVEPEAPRPGDFININGQGFGAEGIVAISGRSLNMVSWSENFIQAQLPEDIIGGERYLVLTLIDGRHSKPYPIFVDAQSGNSSLNPMASDLGVTDMRIADQSLDQGSSNLLEVDLDQPEATVIMEAELKDGITGKELCLSFIARNPTGLNGGIGWESTGLWGAAAHLDYPIDRLDFISMTEPPSNKVAAVNGEISGRVFWYHGQLDSNVSNERYTLITLRFKVLDPNDTSAIRFEVPRRFSSLRGRNNQRLEAVWSSGSVRLGVSQ